MRGSIAFVIAVALLGLSCARGGGDGGPAGGASRPRTERVQMRVDDSLLAGKDSFAIIEPAFWTVDIYGTVRDYESSLARFSRPQRLLLAIHWYASEVDNGGHEQFFYNSTGIVWPDALAAFEEVGIPEAAEILRESLRRMGGSPSRDREQRMDQLERLHPDFDDLDRRFYALQDRVDLDERMLAYARRQPAAFYFSGTVERTTVGPPPLP